MKPHLRRLCSKKPVTFKGSGYAPNELVIVDLMIPKGVKIKTVSEDEEAVGLAFANADENGNVQAKMGATATLNWFFQVGWTPNMKPIFKEATPLPPGNTRSGLPGRIPIYLAWRH